MSRVRSIWYGMHRRCRNEKDAAYPLYGGRGIRVCERWQSFENFLTDMGEPPHRLSIDRIDVNGNYEPGNCRWATASQQNKNKRKKPPPLTAKGKEHKKYVEARRAWLISCGVSRETIIDPTFVEASKLQRRSALRGSRYGQ
jgi:hypothetical protein